MKILMVCLGNICRSPLAHGVFAHLIAQEGLDWTIDSAGTGDWHVGQAPDPRAIQVAHSNGIDISSQRAQQFKKGFFDTYDRILVMDHQNLEDVLRLAENDAQREKVTLFMDQDVVQDPYHDDALFEPVFAQILARSKELIRLFKDQSQG